MHYFKHILIVLISLFMFSGCIDALKEGIQADVLADIKPEIKAEVKANVEAKIASPEFKAEVKKDIVNTLKAEIKQETGGWGISIGTLQVDGASLVIIIGILGSVAIIGYIIYIKYKKTKEKEEKNLTLNKLLVQYNRDKGITQEDKYEILKEAVDKNVAKELDSIVQEQKNEV